MKHCRNQPCLMERRHSMSDIITTKARGFIKSCLKLSDGPRRVFNRFYMLSSLHQRQEEDDDRGQQQQQMFTSLNVNLGRTSFPRYQIHRQRIIFKDRNELIR